MVVNVLVPLSIIVILVVINGVFVAAEFALVAARTDRLQKDATRGNQAARWLVKTLKRKTGKDGYVAVAQLGITLASIGLGMYGEPSVAHWLHGIFERFNISEDLGHTISFVVALSVITFFHVVCGEMIPKALALQNPERVAIRINPLMRLFTTLFNPAVIVLNWTAFALMRLLRIPEPDIRLSLHTGAELAVVTDEAAASGQLGVMQRDIITNLLGLKKRSIEEIMTPRSRLITLDASLTLEEVTEKITTTSQTRYPVVQNDLDNVLGVLHVKDFIYMFEQGSTEWVQAVRPLNSAAATTPVDVVLSKFKTEQVHATLIIDEFGSVLGFVTMDDIISEVMDREVNQKVRRAAINPDGSMIFDGETTVNELADDYDIHIDRPHVITIAGLVLYAHGTVPTVDTTVELDGYQLTVMDLDKRKIVRVLLKAIIDPAI
jgi:CBS domain containing-hemolysin-like protein